MATLNPSNVINGNTIQASDILQLYEAFGTGSQNITGLKMTGSLYGAALTATTASYATTALSSSYASTSATSTSASYATTASYASTSTPPTQLYGTYYSASVGTPNTAFSFIAGYSTTGLTSTSSIAITQLIGKSLGTSAFVTATPSGSGGSNVSIVVNSLAGGNLIFQTSGPSIPFYYTVFYIYKWKNK